MIWFGSSAGVALANMFPEAKSAGRWLLHGWHVTLGYVVGFFALLVVLGWQPHAKHKAEVIDPTGPARLAASHTTSGPLPRLTARSVAAD